MELASDRSSFRHCQKSVGPVYLTSTLDECSNEVALTLEPSVPCLSLQAREKCEIYHKGMRTKIVDFRNIETPKNRASGWWSLLLRRIGSQAEDICHLRNL